QLVIVVAAELEHLGLDLAFIFFCFVFIAFLEVAVKQMALQIDLAWQAEQTALRGIVDFDIGLDTRYLNGTALGRVIKRRGQLDAGVFAERQYALHRTLAKGAAAYDLGAF